MAKLAAALHGARHVAYSSPWRDEKSAQAMIIHDILQRPEFAGTHEVLMMKGNGVNGIKEGADMALQLVCEIRDPAVSVVGPLPPNCMPGWTAMWRFHRAAPMPGPPPLSWLYHPRRRGPVWKAKGLDRP